MELSYIPKFVEIGQLVPKKKILKFFFYHIWAWKPSGHVTNIIFTYFHFHVPKSLYKNLVKKVKWFLRKTNFNFDMLITLGGQSQEMTLTLNTHIPLSTDLAVCIYLCSGHGLQ